MQVVNCTRSVTREPPETKQNIRRLTAQAVPAKSHWNNRQ